MLYQLYAAKRLLPAQRAALQSAQIAMLVDRLNGAKNAKLADYMFDLADDVDVPEDEAADFFGFNPTITREK